MSDVKLTLDEQTGLWDISLANGDLETVESFDTSLVVSLFTDARADVSEMPIPQLQRGFWGDETNDDQTLKTGSKLWLLEQARMTSLILNRAINYTTIALNWLIANKYSQQINVTGEFFAEGQRSGISLNIKIKNANSETESKAYKLWQNTGIAYAN